MSAGPIKSVNIAGRNFVVTGDADANIKLGGFENEVSANGDGATARSIQTVMPWLVGGLSYVIDDARDDQDFLQEIADSSIFYPMTVTKVDGSVWYGQGTIQGELAVSSANGTATFDLSGPGKLAKQ